MKYYVRRFKRGNEMKTGAIQIKNLGQGKGQSSKLCLFLCRLPQFTTTCPQLTGEATMQRFYVVEMHEGSWWVIYKELGFRKFVAPYPTKVEAQFKADRGNLIIQGALEQFMAGVQ